MTQLNNQFFSTHFWLEIPSPPPSPRLDSTSVRSSGSEIVLWTLTLIFLLTLEGNCFEVREQWYRISHPVPSSDKWKLSAGAGCEHHNKMTFKGRVGGASCKMAVMVTKCWKVAPSYKPSILQWWRQRFPNRFPADTKTWCPWAFWKHLSDRLQETTPQVLKHCLSQRDREVKS